MDKKSHWEDVYIRKKPDEVSWYQVRPEYSLRMIEAAKLDRNAGIIDVGGGASSLADCLIHQDYRNLSVLDISRHALDRAKERIGHHAEKIKWIESDVTQFHSAETYHFWHDRAVFHFLTDPEDRERHLNAMSRSLGKNAHVMIATFALDGPEKCSGLPVQRYSHESLQKTLGMDYRLILTDQET